MGRQYRLDPFTGKTTLVGSKAGEKPVKEKQASLLDWGEDTAKLAAWKAANGKEEKDADPYIVAQPIHGQAAAPGGHRDCQN